MKQGEFMWKKGCKNRKKALDQVTIVHPEHYKNRFIKYMKNVVLERIDNREEFDNIEKNF